MSSSMEFEPNSKRASAYLTLQLNFVTSQVQLPQREVDLNQFRAKRNADWENFSGAGLSLSQRTFKSTSLEAADQIPELEHGKLDAAAAPFTVSEVPKIASNTPAPLSIDENFTPLETPLDHSPALAPADSHPTVIYTRVHKPYACVISALHSEDPDTMYRQLASGTGIIWNHSRAPLLEMEAELPTTAMTMGDLPQLPEYNLSLDDDWRTMPFSGQSTRPPSEPAEVLERSNSLTSDACVLLPVAADRSPIAPATQTPSPLHREEPCSRASEDLWTGPACLKADNFIAKGTSCGYMAFTSCPFICAVQIRGKPTWFHSLYAFPEGTTVIVQLPDERVPLDQVQSPADYRYGFHVGVVLSTCTVDSLAIHPEELWQETLGLTVLGRANQNAFRHWTSICQTQGVIANKLFPSTAYATRPLHIVEGRLDGTCWTIIVDRSFKSSESETELYLRARAEFPTFEFRILTA